MRVGHLDCPSGVAGDMLLGALVHAGASLERMQEAVDALGVEPIRLEARQVSRAGLAATKVDVHWEASSTTRSWPDVRRVVAGAALPAAVRERALGVFRRLAAAEATSHGLAPDEVHFHEVGALDALADVVGVCTGVDELGLERLTCGPITTGSRTAATSHGELPAPVPAVVELLTGFRLRGRDEPHELVTPTGAALVAELSQPVAALPPLILTGQGLGAGSRQLAHANVVRLLVGEPTDPQEATETESVVVEATVDDLSPELVPVVLDRLRAAGAHDAWASPTLMKKGRPGFTLVALGEPADVARFEDVLFGESTTLGLRMHPVRRRVLPRGWLRVDVDGWNVAVKVATRLGEVSHVAPEFDDVRAAAEATGRPAREVLERATSLAREALARGAQPSARRHG
ncbi:MAG: nickel pincer cofactor biosynthesis protein LarC [Actinomycetota bacterium]|nr:nickel pincer cofactor biosynthesis protein LarC [Actinomycetota bacterium]